MAIVVLLDPDASVPLQVGWAMWFSRARKLGLTMLLPESSASRDSDVVKKQVESLVAREELFYFDDGSERAAGDERIIVQLLMADADADANGAVVAAVAKVEAELFVVLLTKVEASDKRATHIGREILPRIACSVAVVDLGDERWPVQHLMVAASRGAHPRAALRLARDLGRVTVGSRLTAAYVEPDIGRDAQSVGRHVLDRVVHAAIDDDAANVDRRVVVAANVELGLAKLAEDVEPDVIVLGMPRLGLLGPRFFGLTPARLCKRVEVPVVILRQAMPLGNRLRRGLLDMMQRWVPQVQRQTRVELAARVQTNSAWNFDFVALISLSTVIAALGLLQNSAAVIIGAMLIAPLMTPILGVGLALAQGNGVLAKMAFRSIALGVGTSFLLAVGVGLIEMTSEPIPFTDEMLGRGWPGLIDLMVAFASGLAAAYANSRPGLVAALPGVAIAAALVPPIATSGLAFAAGNFPLAYGAFLLFFANMVAIVLAAGFSLWAVGVRRQNDNAWIRHVGPAFVVMALVLSVYLTQRTRLGVMVPEACVRDAVKAKLPPTLHLLHVTGRRTPDELEVTVHLGGQRPPEDKIVEQLRDAVVAVTTEPVAVHVLYVWRSAAPEQRDE
ncbi:MAG: putative hydrophobic protein (TIGR00271 family) [Hyphomicrobiaceae bacterium]|jgi:uncharacterized hydrophobic protein (TIGR00271 family)